jgi:hypothetical protein
MATVLVSVMAMAQHAGLSIDESEASTWTLLGKEEIGKYFTSEELGGLSDTR